MFGGYFGGAASGQAVSKRTSKRASRKIKHVRFSEKLEIHQLDQGDAKDAWLSRIGPYNSAPTHDELWDGDKRMFRPRPLTKQELKRIKLDSKLKKALPTSIFWVYKKSRKKLPVLEEEEEKRRSNRDSATVPKEFIDELNENLRMYEYENDNPGLKPALKKKDTKRNSGLRRFSLFGGRRAAAATPQQQQQRRDSPFFLDWLQKVDSIAESETDTESEEVAGMAWLRNLAVLDGLERTNVPRSESVENIWDNINFQLQEGLENLKLLGSSFIWDGEAFFQRLFGRDIQFDE